MTAPPSTLQERPINHAEAKEWALWKRDKSNLARCYLDASKLLAEAREALEKADYYIDRLRAAWMKKPVRDLDEASVAYESARAVHAKLKAASVP